MKKDIYDENYFDCGEDRGLSCYTNYRWIPELTFPFVMAYIDYLGIKKEHTVLDFGCAKGYTIKAMRLLHREAFGMDVSSYAVNSADNDTRQYLKIIDENFLPEFESVENFDFIISKDVFEHMEEDELLKVLVELGTIGKKLFAIIPLGKKRVSLGNKPDEFVIPAYGQDKTHVTIKDADWWVDLFFKAGWDLYDYSERVVGIKDNWSNYEGGNGFFTLVPTI